jgi:SulP family sulfate permease
MKNPLSPPSARPTFVELFTPKIITVLREGYGLASLRADLLAGLTVAIVALPLSMAIAIASGAMPERGLFTAVVGGCLISLLGRSRFQIGGPAAAFTVVVATTIANHGLDGLLLATIVAGVFLMLLGFLQLGSYIKFIPYPVTVGFISGIAVILFAGQVHDLLGLTLGVKEPADFVSKLQVLGAAISTANPAAVAVALITISLIVGVRRFRPNWPAILIAVVVALCWCSRSGCRPKPSVRASVASPARCRCPRCRHFHWRRCSRSCLTRSRSPSWVPLNCCYRPLWQTA